MDELPVWFSSWPFPTVAKNRHHIKKKQPKTKQKKLQTKKAMQTKEKSCRFTCIVAFFCLHCYICFCPTFFYVIAFWLQLFFFFFLLWWRLLFTAYLLYLQWLFEFVQLHFLFAVTFFVWSCCLYFCCNGGSRPPYFPGTFNLSWTNKLVDKKTKYTCILLKQAKSRQKILFFERENQNECWCCPKGKSFSYSCDHFEICGAKKRFTFKKVPHRSKYVKMC